MHSMAWMQNKCFMSLLRDSCLRGRTWHGGGSLRVCRRSHEVSGSWGSFLRESSPLDFHCFSLNRTQSFLSRRVLWIQHTLHLDTEPGSAGDVLDAALWACLPCTCEHMHNWMLFLTMLLFLVALLQMPYVLQRSLSAKRMSFAI